MISDIPQVDYFNETAFLPKDERLLNNTNREEARPAIEKFSIDYDMPMSLAVCLVGRTEQQTADNIAAFIAYLKSVIDKYREYRRG